MSASSFWPHGAGEMAGCIRTFDWSRTPLGPVAIWTERCRNVVDMVLAIGLPAIVLVGRDLVQIYNDAYRELMGAKHPAGLGQPTRDCWPEVWHINQPIYERVLAGETVTLEDALYPLDRDGTTKDVWLTLSYSPLRDGNGAVTDILVTMFETTERVRTREALQAGEVRLQVMVAELHHRTRNLIGIVGTIARRLTTSSLSLEDFRSRFTERLEALSRVQSLLFEKNGERIELADIVRLELDALGADLKDERIAIEGEAVPLRRSAVQMLALATHELATNARKYGALRAAGGRLDVRWDVAGTAAGGRQLRFAWTEIGIDPRVEETAGPMHRGGYGRELIERALPYALRAETRYTLGADRLDCIIRVPLDD